MADLSLGEYQALTAKAFRGAGYPWGVVEDAADACRTLARWGIDPSAAVIRLLRAVDGEPLQYWPDEHLDTLSGALCPIAVGCWIRDIGDGGGIDRLDLPHLLEPLLLAPAMATLATTEADYQLTWQGGSIVVAGSVDSRAGVEPMFAEPATPAQATLKRVKGLSIKPTPRATRVSVAAESVAELERFAARTYAPNTATSRTSGAGPA